MYTIISGTNRRDSNTLIVAAQYQQYLKEKSIDAKLLSLENVNPLIKDEQFTLIESAFLCPADKFIFIAPEYNGSIPGILKLLIDEADWKTAWKNKKAMLVGISTGRAGNLRGLDHLASILHHMRMQVLPFMLPISQVDKLINGKEMITDEITVKVIKSQVDEFVNF
jgi:chromate reductase, NAD(P)H dehydrogenase (quinone)